MFGIMDDSGDGQLQAKEIMMGLSKCEKNFVGRVDEITNEKDIEPS